MRLVLSLVLSCAVVALSPNAMAAQDRSHRPISKTAIGQRSMSSPEKAGVVLRQDLFDRANPTNVRGDWPAPPAQPGQY